MAKVYDPIMCMMVERGTNDAKAKDVQVKLYSVSYKSNGVYQTIGVYAENETHAKEKARRYFEGRGKEAEIIGASIGESYATMKAKGKPVLDARTCDADPVFKNIYNSFASSINASRKMDPKAANSYVEKIMKGCIDDLDKAFRTYNQEYNEVRERIMREGQKEMSDIFERYLKEGKK